MTNDVPNLDALFRQLLALSTKLPSSTFRPANINSFQGPGLFFTAQVMTIQEQGQPEDKYVNDPKSTNVIHTVTGPCQISLSVNAYRRGAMTAIGRLPRLMRLQSAIDFCNENGLAYVSAAQARDLTTLVETQFEERGQIDMLFSIIASEQESLATYGKFPFSFTLDNGYTVSQEVISP